MSDVPSTQASPTHASPLRRFAGLWVLLALVGITAGWQWLVGQGYYLVPWPVTVREARPTDPLAERYFCFSDDDMQARNVAVVSGPFSLETGVSACLFLVRSGRVEVVNSFVAGRSRNQFGSPDWKRLTIRLALGEKDTPAGRVTTLGSAGQSWGSGQMGKGTLDFRATVSQVLPGRLPSGREQLVYVEGDSEFVADRDLSIEEFATRNGGNYLVVMVRLN